MLVASNPTTPAEALFDKVGGAYEDAYRNNEGLQKALIRLREYQSAGASVLDIGCGPGGPASLMAKLGLDVTGIDVSQNMVDICRKNIPGTFHKANMINFETPRQFDGIVVLFSLFQVSYRAPRLSWVTPRSSFGPVPFANATTGTHLLSEGAWNPFAERLTRRDFDAVIAAVASNKQVLDVGSGHGELPVAIAKKCGKAYAIEPNTDRNKLLVKNGENSKVEVREGSAENLPFSDKKFDAVVALWILHYVNDLEKSLTEMVRVVDPAAPNARIVIVQGAPDKEVVNLINKACALIAGEGMVGSAIDHQGYLLATACRVFTQLGFGNITLSRVDVNCNFPEEDMAERCTRAAAVLTDFWYKDHSKNRDMRRQFQPVLREHFLDRALEVGDQAVILVAQPDPEGEVTRSYM